MEHLNVVHASFFVCVWLFSLFMSIMMGLHVHLSFLLYF